MQTTTDSQTTVLGPHLYLLAGAVNTGVLVAGERALLFDCCDTVSPTRLKALGVQQVDLILCTQHRRPNAAGADPFVQSGARLVVPAGERHLFEEVDRYWADWRNRWHLYHHQPGPQVLARPLPVARGVQEGEVIEWQGYTIQVLGTPGATDGSISYLLRVGDLAVCFCGDVLYGPGQVWDLACLQKGFGGVLDYHGLLGNRRQLLSSLGKLGACGADLLVPSHGQPLREPAMATTKTAERLEAAWRNLASISSLNFYFPSLLDDTRDDPARLPPAATFDPPEFLRPVAFTSFAVVSDSGAVLLVDCGHDSVVQTLLEWQAAGRIGPVELCWVTHYHDDHVDSLHRVATTFGCPILADRHFAEILESPRRFLLPCISPNPAFVHHATDEGESWQWQEFRLTAFHFPGQTFYHGGLLVEGHGCKVFFAGDSGSPSGLDDYTAPNRVFLGPGRGSRRCLDIWRRWRPDFIVNNHQSRPFRFTDEELDYMEKVLSERERLLGELVPWAHPDFALDESWVRTYPYEQEAVPGSTICIQVHFTNHGAQEALARAEPILAEGWQWHPHRSQTQVRIPARSDGWVDPESPTSDGSLHVWFTIPEATRPGRYVIPFRVWWEGRYLGQFRHAVVVVW